ncbi:hypothetical protein C5167_035491 [Papaver somniferum]|uniref:Uncharacterized protein n=1 Tax=Papaver somniferum TaxID=3469 RepID=A0A4Y7K9S7_PAPSO|nr:hypothetical protein C5167_035491 [Papaver somniferum]
MMMVMKYKMTQFANKIACYIAYLFCKKMTQFANKAGALSDEITIVPDKNSLDLKVVERNTTPLNPWLFYFSWLPGLVVAELEIKKLAYIADGVEYYL